MSCFNLNIVDVDTFELPLAVGKVKCYIEANAKQLLFCSSEAEPVCITVKHVFVMNDNPGWTLSLDWRRPALPAVVFLSMYLWNFPMENFFVSETATGGIKVFLGLAISIPLLLRRGRQQLAIELEENQGVIIVETHDARATALLLNL